MSPVSRLSVLAFAAAVVAIPQDHAHGHAKFHARVAASASASLASAASYSGRRSASGSGSASGYSKAPRSSASKLPVVSSIAPAYYTDAPAGYGAPSSTTCTDEVTVTNTEQTTIYVTASGAAPSERTTTTKVQSTQHVTVSVTLQSSQETSSKTSSTEVAPVASSPSSTYTAPAYSAPSTYTTSSSTFTSAPAYTAPTTSSTIAVEPTTTSSTKTSSSTTSTSSSTSSTVSVALPTTLIPTYSQANKGAVGSTSSAAAPSASSYSSSGSSNSGKRGLAYNTASLTSCFSGSSQISWAYNWGSSSSGLSMPGVSFIPTLWGTSSDFVTSWATNAAAAISSGSTHLFSFNEPDLSAQSNLSPAAAAAAYITHMMPFAGKAKMCAPSVTNGGGAMGLTWLQNFLDACPTCQIDCVNIHWYDSASNVDYFKEHVTNATQIANGKPVFISEFGATGSDAEISSFLQEVMPWMDSQSGVAGYAYYMVAPGLLVNGNEPSSYGSTYMTYTG